MPASLLVSRTIHPGEETVIDVTSGMYSVVFKDNGETGYVYAMDNGRPEPVLDALHLYNVDQFEKKHAKRTADIEIWASEDGLGTLVKLNGRDEAYFDFADRPQFFAAIAESNVPSGVNASTGRALRGSR